LHFDEFVQGKRLTVRGKVNEFNLGDGLEVVFNTIFDDIVDGNDELLEFAETFVDVLEVSIDVHRSPGEGEETGSKLEFEIFNVRSKDVLGDGLDLADNSFVLTKKVVEFVEVHLELFFLEEDDSGRFRDADLDSFEALGFSDKFEDVVVKVDDELLVLFMTNDQGGLETALGSFDVGGPIVEVPHFVDGKLFTEGVVVSVVFLQVRGGNGGDHLEFGDGASDFLEEMLGPDDLTSLRGHVSDDLRVALALTESGFNGIEFSGVVVENGIVL
jgi:hypothetical protein